MVKETFNAKETFEAGYEMGKKALPGQIYSINTKQKKKTKKKRACQQPYIYNYSGIP